ncbi:hypothetical protein P7K49_025195 [Saguinus oedipus]|uniref:Uncharacterized protein n=1 Tax=Saguinus oedipus TaxID=9490 RepID=A0ABQ9UGI2_SAGOE|nr:hypothetical protein P7K49_025195 [Saguinus oedipus]
MFRIEETTVTAALPNKTMGTHEEPALTPTELDALQQPALPEDIHPLLLRPNGDRAGASRRPRSCQVDHSPLSSGGACMFSGTAATCPANAEDEDAQGESQSQLPSVPYAPAPVQKSRTFRPSRLKTRDWKAQHQQVMQTPSRAPWGSTESTIEESWPRSWSSGLVSASVIMARDDFGKERPKVLQRP